MPVLCMTTWATKALILLSLLVISSLLFLLFFMLHLLPLFLLFLFIPFVMMFDERVKIITIIQDDDGSGWTKGQNSHGNVGLFPTSYIQYL